jgi:flagella basal body P-ring formation protein FlgA
MTVTVKNIIPCKQAENAQTTQYTATNCKTIIDKFTVTNITAGNVTLSCNLVPSSGAAGATNLIISARAIAPGETYTCPELVGQSLEPGGFISTLAGAAVSLNISASGREIT